MMAGNDIKIPSVLLKAGTAFYCYFFKSSVVFCVWVGGCCGNKNLHHTTIEESVFFFQNVTTQTVVVASNPSQVSGTNYYYINYYG